MNIELSLGQRIEQIERRQALNDLVANYFLQVDARTYDTLALLFTKDAVVTFAHMEAKGREELIAFWERRLSNYEFTNHCLHSHILTSISDATATGIVTGHAEHGINGTCILAALRYDDHYAFVDGAWRIRLRKLSTRYFLPWNEMDGKFHEGAVSGRPNDKNVDKGGKNA